MIYVCACGDYPQLTEERSSLTKQYERSEKLQLKQLSLCSVGFTERFLWVQNLDLSHNQLRSTHGNVLSCVIQLVLHPDRIFLQMMVSFGWRNVHL